MAASEQSESIVEASRTEASGDMLADFRDATRDQLEAAWQLHVDHVEEELSKGWREQVGQVLEDRFRELCAAIEQQVDRRVAERGEEIHVAAARAVTAALNQAARRLRQHGDSAGWARALLDAAASFCGWTALYRVRGDNAWILLPGSLDDAPSGPHLALGSAPALRNAVESREPVVAAFTESELSSAVTALAPQPADGRVSLFPVVSGDHVPAVLHAQSAGCPVDANALELLASLAGDIHRARTPGDARAGLVTIAGAARGASASNWSQLSREDQDIHLRAQRFARVQVAEMRLYKSDAVKAGRAARDLYRALRDDIDAGRSAFRQQFMDGCPSMVDYFHLELIRTLANDDESLLGPEYPGPLA